MPGLRREEVALLAGISPEYYLRLEQGRDHRPSDQVLDSIARALQLDADASAHLRELAHPRPGPRRSARPERVSTGVQDLIDAWTTTPTHVHGRHLDVLPLRALRARSRRRRPRLVTLIGELSLGSERFRTLRARHDIRHRTSGAIRLVPPQVGALDLRYEKFTIPGTGQVLVTHHAEPGSTSDERLHLLGSLAETSRRSAR